MTRTRSGSPKISAVERHLLVEEIAIHTSHVRENLRKTGNWAQLSKYIGLIGIAGFTERELQPPQAAHTRKMLALEATSIREPRTKPKAASKFWEAVESAAELEIQEARKFQDETSILPRAYQLAGKDLSQVKVLLANPVLLELKQSLRDIKNKRQ